MSVREQAQRGKRCWENAPAGGKRDDVLRRLALRLSEREAEILQANQADLERETELHQAMQDRLRLTPARIKAMAEGLREVADLPDPLGQVQMDRTLANGLRITKVTVPLGLVGIIYEARPNVTIEAGSLVFKAGNAVLLRGGSAARCSNEVLVGLFREVLSEMGLEADLVQLLADSSREAGHELMRCHEFVDVLIPRGGPGLIRQVVEEARVPVIRTGEGNCHLYVDEFADLAMAEAILANGKLQRPSVCNATETLLVHQAIAEDFLPRIAGLCELRVCERSSDYVLGIPAVEADFATEFNDLVLAVKVVDDLDEAIQHIRHYGTGHSEAIVTTDPAKAEHFLNSIDAAAVYVNASTRFTDGGQFGFGGELGISTQKLHARGPMGLDALVSYKYKIYGKGQVRS